MNSTSQNPRDGKTLYLTLSGSTVVGLLFTLIQYYVFHGNPLNRVGYAIYVSVLPALAALVVLKLTNFSVSWRGAVGSTWATTALVYLLFFVLVFVGLLVK